MNWNWVFHPFDTWAAKRRLRRWLAAEEKDLQRYRTEHNLGEKR